MINKKDLDKKAIDLGALMGLLTDSGGSLSVDTDWFRDPVAAIGGVDTRLHRLVSLIASLLGPGIDDAPAVFPEAAWYAIPDTENRDTTPFYLVMPKGAPTSGEIGLGMAHPLRLGNLTITAFIYLPLFSYAPSGAALIVNSPEHALQIGLSVTTSTTFAVEGASFKALKIDGRIYLSGRTPEFRMEFLNLKGTEKPGTYTRLEDLLDPTVAAWIGEVMVQGSYWLDLYVGDSPTTVGEILVAARFLSLDAKGAYHLDLRNLRGRSATEIALDFLFAGLEALSRIETPLLKLPGGGVYIQHRESTGDYGLRIAALLPLLSEKSAEGKAPPAVDLSLGAWLADESDANNWMQRITDDGTHRPGLSIYALRRGADRRLSFAPGFDITSVGLDIRGGGDAPLFDINGYTLRGAQIRSYLSSENWPFGFVIRLENVGIPLAPGFDNIQHGGSGSNPVAASLIASGSGSQQESSAESSATNPLFSAQAGYVHGFTPLLEIFDPEGNATDVIWFPIQRRFGPLNCRKIGLKIATAGDQRHDPLLGMIFDGSVALGPLAISLDQLSVDAHLKDIANVAGYGLDLQGLGITFNNGGVTVSGGLLKGTAADGSITYSGQAMIKYGDLTIAALGSYGTLPNNGGTSMFIFALLNKPIGGPAFFYVTGLSAGFGYNRALRLPAQGDVRNFPLLAGLSNPALIGGSNPSPQEALQKLDSWVPPSRGDYWLAAGVQFTTFEIINSNALLMVQFGNELIISVLGISTLKQPQKGTTYVYAELEISVVFRPDRGELQAAAMLAPSSFVMTPKAKLTGGFAFFAWFDNHKEHPGDFVFTIGGYHPAFTPPSHYPKVPRVGINWKVSNSISITGGAYFAITPAAMMAGGTLELTFADGPLKAWLRAKADVLLYWKPFYLLADVSVSVGVSFRIHALFVDVTLSVEIGAEFHLWGPPIGGSVHVDWYVISFTISFGEGRQQPEELTWSEFREMLPHKSEPQHVPRRIAAPMAALNALAANATAASEAPAAKSAAFLQITGNKGPQEVRELEGLSLWLVRAGDFQFTVGSAVPASTVVVESHRAAEKRVIAGNKVSIRRVNGGISAEDYQSTQTVTILKLATDNITHIRACMATESPCTTHPAACPDGTIDITGWEIEAVQKNLPQAMWGATLPAGEAPSPGTATITGTVGVTMYPKPRVVTNCTPQMTIADIFTGRVINPGDEYHLPIQRGRQPYDQAPHAAETFTDIALIDSESIAEKRTAVFTALQRLGANGWTNEPLPRMAANPGNAFADEPMEGATVTAQSWSSL